MAITTPPLSAISIIDTCRLQTVNAAPIDNIAWRILFNVTEYLRLGAEKYKRYYPDPSFTIAVTRTFPS